MDAAERAGQIVEALQQARAGWPIGATFTVSVRGGKCLIDEENTVAPGTKVKA